MRRLRRPMSIDQGLRQVVALVTFEGINGNAPLVRYGAERLTVHQFPVYALTVVVIANCACARHGSPLGRLQVVIRRPVQSRLYGRWQVKGHALIR